MKGNWIRPEEGLPTCEKKLSGKMKGVPDCSGRKVPGSHAGARKP